MSIINERECRRYLYLMKKLMILNLTLLIVLMNNPGNALSAIFLCKKGKYTVYQDSPCQPEYEQQVIDSNIAAPSITGKTLDETPIPVGSAAIPDASSTKLVLTRSADSHFYIDGNINGVSIHFLIDTGASIVALPEEIAKAAKLVKEEDVILKTAGGTAKGYQTTITQLTLMSFSFKSVTAEIVPGSQALLGMSILSQFTITQTADQMILQYK
jgi:aspartyl protease family protein